MWVEIINLNVVVVGRLHYINTLKQELSGTKAYKETSEEGKSVVNGQCNHLALKFSVCVKECQDRLPTMYWLLKLHKRPYKARFIANSSSCTTTEFSKLLTSCLTAVKNQAIRYCEKVYERSGKICFGQLKILVRYSGFPQMQNIASETPKNVSGTCKKNVCVHWDSHVYEWKIIIPWEYLENRCLRKVFALTCFCGDFNSKFSNFTCIFVSFSKIFFRTRSLSISNFRNFYHFLSTLTAELWR